MKPKKKKKKKKVKIVSYAERNAILLRTGYATYRDYLKSELWVDIKTKILTACNHRCRLCREHTNTVHHTNYNRRTLEGKNFRFLVPLCNGCHYKTEFDFDGSKLTVGQAHGKLKKRRRKRKGRPEIGLAYKAKYQQR